MRRAFARLARSNSGATAVEFGLIAVPLLLIVFGTIEYGRLMWTREALQQTAIAGARCMGLVQTSCGTSGTYDSGMTQSYVIAQGAQWSIPLTTSSVTLNNSATCGGVGGFSQVTIAYAFSSLVPQEITALANGANLSASACFPNHK